MKPRKTRLAELSRESGATAASIAKKLSAEGYGSASRASVGRDLVTIKGRQRVGRVGKKAEDRTALVTGTVSKDAEVPTSEQVANATDLRQLDDWLGIAARLARQAEKNADHPLLLRATSIATSILEARRKAEPSAAPVDGVWLSSGDVGAHEAQLATAIALLARAVAEQVHAGAVEPRDEASAIERALFQAWSAA